MILMVAVIEYIARSIKLVEFNEGGSGMKLSSASRAYAKKRMERIKLFFLSFFIYKKWTKIYLIQTQP